MPQPERDGGNSPKKESPGDQVDRHPQLWKREETTGRSKRPREPPNTSTSGSHHSNQEETSQHCESKAPKLRPGEPGKEKQTVSQFHAMLKVKTVTTGGTENGQKRRRHDRYDSAQDKAQELTRTEPQPPRK